MTDDLKQLIVSAHKAEQEDVEKYTEMIEKLNIAHCYKAAGIIADIKHDEETHINALAHILEMEEVHD